MLGLNYFQGQMNGPFKLEAENTANAAPGGVVLRTGAPIFLINLAMLHV